MELFLVTIIENASISIHQIMTTLLLYNIGILFYYISYMPLNKKKSTNKK